MTLERAGSFLQTHAHIENENDTSLQVLVKALRSLKEKLPGKSHNSTEAHICQGIEAVAIILEKVKPDTTTDDEWKKTLTGILEQQAEQIKEMKETVESKVKELEDKLMKQIDAQKHDILEKIDSNRSQVANNAQGQTQDPTSYAQIIAMQLSQPQHDAWINKGKTTEQQLVIRKPRGGNRNPIEGLNEEELMKKAEIAMDTMGIAASDSPENTKFIGTRKLAGGDILLELSNSAAGKWIKQPDVLKSFNDNFSGTLTVVPRTFPIIMEFLPIFTDITNNTELRQIEAINSLAAFSLQSGRWLKDPDRRKATQHYAHAQVGCTDADTANNIIRNGIMVHGRCISARKPAIEISRCTKCQHRTWHKANDCKAITDACARCTGQHRTSECQVQSSSDFQCAICRNPGHRAASIECPTYQEKLTRLKNQTPEHRYLFYPTNQPWTWVKQDDKPLLFETALALQQKTNTWGGKVTNYHYNPRNAPHTGNKPTTMTVTQNTQPSAQQTLDGYLGHSNEQDNTPRQLQAGPLRTNQVL